MSKVRRVCLVIGILICVMALFVALAFFSPWEFEKYETVYSFNNPDHTEQLVVTEWYGFKQSGLTFSLMKSGHEVCTVSASTNEYLPFKENKYDIIWSDDFIVVRFAYDHTGTLWDTISLPRDIG